MNSMQFKLISYNIFDNDFYRLERIQKIINILKKYQPDIIAFQEITPITFDILKKSSFINNTYYFNIEKLNGMCNSIILTRYPIISSFTEKLPFTKTFRELQCITIMIKSKKIHILNTHLESIFTKNNIKTEQLAYILSKYNYLDNIFLLADTNITTIEEEKKTIDLMKNNDWIDSFIEIQNSYPILLNDIKNTFDYEKNPLIKGRFKSRLDRILYKSKKFNVSSVELVGKDLTINTVDENIPPSDHFGIYVTMVLSDLN